MRSFAILLRKEEMALFSSPIAYVVMTVFLLIMGYSFTLTLFISHQPSMVHIFFQMFVLFMLTAPLITMRLLAEERKLRTMEVLLTSPVSEVAIVLAKYFASMSLIVVMLLLSGCTRRRSPGSAIPISDRSIAAISACCCLVRPWSGPDCWHRRSRPTR
jgi:ABC-2 type transport system permease protein